MGFDGALVGTEKNLSKDGGEEVAGKEFAGVSGFALGEVCNGSEGYEVDWSEQPVVLHNKLMHMTDCLSATP